LYGYGWPIYRGGPMFYADLVGLKTIVERLEFYAQSLDEPTLKPTDLLRRLANEGNSFASLNATSRAPT
jgi:3-hydroxyacyl-CoA dehydrogenase